jgi:MFS family permease
MDVSMGNEDGMSSTGERHDAHPGAPSPTILRLIADELIRRLEAEPAMARVPTSCTPAEQAHLGAVLLNLTALREARRVLDTVSDLPVTAAEVWPELANLLTDPQLNRPTVSNGNDSESLVATNTIPVVPLLPPGNGAVAPLPRESDVDANVEGRALLVPAKAARDAAEPSWASVAHRFPALRFPNFVLLWTALIVSSAGTQMQLLAVNWLVLDLWHSPIAIGVVSAAFAIPMIALPYFGGAVADRVNRLALLRLTQAGQLLCAGLLTLLATLGVVQIWEIVAIIAISASFLAFDNPARQALFPDLVDRSALMSAISLQSAAFTGGALIGPAIGGLLLPHVRPAGIFFLNTLSYLAVLGALVQIRGATLSAKTVSRQALGPWLSSGLAYVRHTRVVLLLLALSFVGNLLGRSFIPLLAILARDSFHVGAAGYGLMVAAVGLGALVGAFGLAGLKDVHNKGRLCLAAITLFCVTLELVALNPAFPVAVATLTLAGLSSTVFSACIATSLQQRVPRELRGRVMSLYTITLIGVASLGALGSSVAAAATSASAAYIGGASLFALSALVVSWPLWQMDQNEIAPASVSQRAGTG